MAKIKTKQGDDMVKQKKGVTGAELLADPYALLKQMVNRTKQPKVYRTNNTEHHGRICIDFYPTRIPTVASFGSLEELKAWIVEHFGINQFALWFPGGISEEWQGRTYHVSATED
jgi:hypothetical protein